MKRVERVKKKAWVPRLLAGVVCILLVSGLVYFFSPEGLLTLSLFFGLVFLGSFFLSSLVWNQLRRSLFSAIFVLVFFVMRYYHVGNWLNTALFGAFLATIEIYVSKYR